MFVADEHRSKAVARAHEKCRTHRRDEPPFRAVARIRGIDWMRMARRGGFVRVHARIFTDAGQRLANHGDNEASHLPSRHAHCAIVARQGCGSDRGGTAMRGAQRICIIDEDPYHIKVMGLMLQYRNAYRPSRSTTPSAPGRTC